MRDEIVSGLKNAIERGASLEQAINSFISAGYNPAEVRAAAQSFGGAITVTQDAGDAFSGQEFDSSNSVPTAPDAEQRSNQVKPQSLSVQQPMPQPDFSVKPQNTHQQPRGKKSGKKVWIIILLIVLFFLIAGAMALIIFADSLLGAFG